MIIFGRKTGLIKALMSALLTFSIFAVVGCNNMEDYATFKSPDGKFKIVVVRKGSYFGSSPGQGGDSPGEVRLVNSSGDILNKTDVEMVQLVENVQWESKKVYIKLIADWDLPE